MDSFSNVPARATAIPPVERTKAPAGIEPADCSGRAADQAAGNRGGHPSNLRVGDGAAGSNGRALSPGELQGGGR